ncbi:hypothetical protein Golomagni_01836, partial [Golovinomyces magnicellulatus]
MAEEKSSHSTPQISDFTSWTANKVNNASATDITNYINERLAEYEDENLYVGELHGYFRIDFQDFTVTARKKTTEPTKLLREFLRKRSVFIPKGRAIQIASSLVDAVRDPFCPMPNDIMNKSRRIQNYKISPNPDITPCNSIITLMKAYTDDKKYRGTPSESFDSKFTIFIDYCNVISIPNDQRNLAFKIMLEDTALQHYYESCNPNTPPQLDSLYQTIKSYFEGQEHQQSMLVKWNETTIGIILRNIESPDVPEFRADKILFAKLLQACRSHPAGSIACSTLVDENLSALINRLRSNVATWKAQQNNPSEQSLQPNFHDSEIFLTDRRYHGG